MGSGSETGNASSDQFASSITTIGVIDLLQTGANDRSSGLRSSIILVVDSEDGAIGEDLLQTCLPAVPTDPESAERETGADSDDVVVESLALLCDVLVLRGNDHEKWRTAIRRGHERRRSAGMSPGKLWIESAGDNLQLSHIAMEPTDDHDDSPAATTCSTLFPGATTNPRELRELVASTARQVIVSHDATAPQDSFPSVSVQYRSQSQSQIQIQKHHNSGAEPVAAIEKTQTKQSQTDPPADDSAVIADVLDMARRKLEDLETKMEELVLKQSSSSSNNPMPLLEFGSLVQDILKTTDTRLREETSTPEAFRRGLTKCIVAEVQRLYQDQLQALRNYYGQRYEAILDQEPEEDENAEATERRWAVGAEHSTRGFVAAAKNAVPTVFRIDESTNADAWTCKNAASFDHVTALQGLIRDMLEATERRKEDQAVATLVAADEDETKTSEGTPAKSRKFRFPEVPKWLERLAARAVVFGVNYIQGWLAWQGIKRAALERDRNQPKFPLF